MQQIDTYDKDLARRRRIEAEYKKRVKGQMFDPGSNRDNITGLPNPVDKPGKKPVINSFHINLK